MTKESRQRVTRTERLKASIAPAAALSDLAARAHNVDLDLKSYSGSVAPAT